LITRTVVLAHICQLEGQFETFLMSKTLVVSAPDSPQEADQPASKVHVTYLSGWCRTRGLVWARKTTLSIWCSACTLLPPPVSFENAHGQATGGGSCPRCCRYWVGCMCPARNTPVRDTSEAGSWDLFPAGATVQHYIVFATLPEHVKYHESRLKSCRRTRLGDARVGSLS